MKLTKSTIDSHMHLYNWYRSDGVDYFKILDDVQKETNMKGLCIAALADKIYGGPDINIMSAIYKLHNSTAYAYANFFFPEYPVNPSLPEGLDSLTQYKEFMDIGFDGIKILYKPDIQKDIKMLINDSYYEPFFAQAEKDNTNILWHVADPEYCWFDSYTGPWAYSNEEVPKFKDMLIETFDVLQKHPNLNVTFAHFLFLSEYPEKLEYIFNKYKNVKIDITPHPGMYKVFLENYDFYRDFFEKFSDRIIFGTDASVPNNRYCAVQIKTIYDAVTTADEILIGSRQNTKGLNLSDETCNKILHKNFLKACSEKPKPINKDALKEYAKKYMPYITNESNKTPIINFLKNLD